MRRKTKRYKENKRNTTRHLFASIVARNIHQKLEMNVGN
jgi:hypothetical protein